MAVTDPPRRRLAALRRAQQAQRRRAGAAAAPGFAPGAGPSCATATDLDRAMMQRALALAEQAAAQGEVPIGAVVYRDGEVLAEAANEREASGDPTGHAEIVALRRAGERLGSWRLSGCSMAVTLEPCPMCAGALVNARLARCVYGAADPKAGACGTLYRIAEDPRLNHRVEVIGGVRAEDSVRLLQRFFASRRGR